MKVGVDVERKKKKKIWAEKRPEFKGPFGTLVSTEEHTDQRRCNLASCPGGGGSHNLLLDLR